MLDATQTCLESSTFGVQLFKREVLFCNVCFLLAALCQIFRDGDGIKGGFDLPQLLAEFRDTGLDFGELETPGAFEELALIVGRKLELLGQAEQFFQP